MGDHRTHEWRIERLEFKGWMLLVAVDICDVLSEALVVLVIRRVEDEPVPRVIRRREGVRVGSNGGCGWGPMGCERMGSHGARGCGSVLMRTIVDRSERGGRPVN